MTPETLSEIGLCLHTTPRWQRPLAARLMVDQSLVRRWAGGERPIPDWAETKLMSVMLTEASTFEGKAKRLREFAGSLAAA
jgi:hypothetical protein